MTEIALISVVDEVMLQLNPIAPFLKTTVSSLVGSVYFVSELEGNEAKMPFSLATNSWDFTSAYLSVPLTNRTQL